jgi:gliding motility-associated-like protein
MPRKPILLLLILGLCHVSVAQVISTYAGTGIIGYSGDGGPATAAQLYDPFDVAADNAGNLYIADMMNNRIRKVNSAGMITTYAGTATLGYSGDGGPAVNANLYHPNNLCLDPAGNLYFSDQNADVIRKISPAGIISSITGNLPSGYSGDGGPLALAQFRSITGLQTDAAGNLYISDNGNHIIRKVNSAGIITTFAGTPELPGFSGDGGPALAATLQNPFGVVIRSDGSMLIPDAGNRRIRRVSPAGVMSSIAGTGVNASTGNGGPATAASLAYPWRIADDAAGNLYVADPINEQVRRITPAGIIDNYAGNGIAGYSGDNGPAVNAQLFGVAGICCDPAGNLYITHNSNYGVIRKVTNCAFVTISQQPANANICVTGNASFSVTAGNALTFQWQMNSGTGWTDITDNAMYTGAQTNNLAVTGITTAMDNYFYRCMLSNSCGPVYTNTAILFVNTPVTPSVTITANFNNICAGSPVIFMAATQHGGPAPFYQWRKNGLPVGTNSNAYSDNALANGDLIRCDLTSGASCVTASNVSSNTISMQVNTPVTPTVSITSSATGPVCFGTPVTFTATTTHPGSAPHYTWFKNSTNLFLDSPVYTDNALNNGDVILCAMRTSLSCVTIDQVVSNTLFASINPLVTPAVAVTTASASVCRNTPVQFIATAVNGGTNPVYTWKKNNQFVGTNSPVYIDNTIANGDLLTCELVSNAGCLATASAISSPVIMTIHPDPVVRLDQQTGLCSGSSRQLDAGSFSSYAWNTGAGTRTISVSTTGMYAVTVTDANGCKGADTTYINQFYPLPAKFLPADTGLCSYGSFLLNPLSNYSAYNWSTGNHTSQITVTQPGIYWLDVTDLNNCVGRDSIVITPRECLKGLYVPSGFTPNGDGRNDILKPFLFGNVKKYEFRIYNRWGETVFHTKDLNAGWNGMYKGLLMDGNVYAWICRYQLEGEEEKTGKGTFVLIR